MKKFRNNVKSDKYIWKYNKKIVTLPTKVVPKSVVTTQKVAHKSVTII